MHYQNLLATVFLYLIVQVFSSFQLFLLNYLDHLEVGVAHRDGLRGAPPDVGDGPGVDEVDLGPERAVEAVLPALQRREDREVLRLQFVVAGLELIGEGAAVDEHRFLALTNDELGTVLDLVLVPREPPRQRRPRVIDPLDDVDEFTLDFVEETHTALNLGETRRSGRRNPW